MESGGQGNRGSGQGGSKEDDEMIYVPETLRLKLPEGVELNGNQMAAAGGSLYFYSSNRNNGSLVSEFYRFEPGSGGQETGSGGQKIDGSGQETNSSEQENDNGGQEMGSGEGSFVKLPVSVNAGMGIASYTVDQDGNFYFFLQDYTLKKVNAQGQELFSVDLSEAFGEKEETENQTGSMGGFSYVVMFAPFTNGAVDAEGNLYATKDSKIYLMDSAGNALGVIPVEGEGLRLSSLAAGKDGKVYAVLWDSAAGENLLAAVDPQKMELGKRFGSLPGDSDAHFFAGADADFLIYDGTALYEYDMNTETSRTLAKWLDCDIQGSSLQAVAQQDGEIFLAVYDWMMEENSTEILHLVKRKASELPVKEEIVIGSLASDKAFLGYAVVSFNKQSDKYHVSIREYGDADREGTEALAEAMQAMNNDLLSRNSPDLLDLSMVDIGSLVSRGLLEDLNTYLDSDQKVRKEDFLQSVLDAATFQDTLTCIPRNFTLSTLAGRSALVGEKMGWRLEDLMALAKANPNAELFENADRDTILESCLTFGWSRFIDWESGKVSLDSPEFKQLLEFAASFPQADSAVSQADGKSTMQKLLDGDMLLYQADISSPEQITEAAGMFGAEKVTFVGYPSENGNGCRMILGDGCFGILSASGHKEGAWEFLRFLLEEDGLPRIRWETGMSARADQFEQEIEKAAEDPYEKDMEGQIRLDEKGDPVRRSYGGIYDMQEGTMIPFYVPLPEDINVLRNLLDGAGTADSRDEVIWSIVSEEAAAFFQGQKTVDDVAEVIQNRVSLYVNERQ